MPCNRGHNDRPAVAEWERNPHALPWLSPTESLAALPEARKLAILAAPDIRRSTALIRLWACTVKGSDAKNQDCVDHEPVHGCATPIMMIRLSKALLSA